jgi:hypothetical protein
MSNLLRLLDAQPTLLARLTAKSTAAARQKRTVKRG